MSDVNAIKSYLDFAGLSNLRAKAKDDQTSAAKEVGRQFEAMFVQMMMKSVRQANESIKSDLMGSCALNSLPLSLRLLSVNSLNARVTLTSLAPDPM